jgi:hypothetical protein
VVGQVIEATPGALDLLELLVVDDLVDLRRQLLVDARDHFVDRVDHIVFDEGRIGKRLPNERRDGILDFGLGPLRARLEGLLQERREIIGLRRCLAGGLVSLYLAHDPTPPLPRGRRPKSRPVVPPLR